MRRTVAALVAALLVLTLAGCSGGTEQAPADADAAGDAAASEAQAEQPETMSDRSANVDEATPTPFPSFETTAMPAVFQEKIEAHRPMLILFYDSRQLVSDDVRSQVDAALSEYRGLIDFVSFDVGGREKSAAQAAAVYASELGVEGTPYILVVDRHGFVTWRWKGFVDRDIIKREVERATR